MAKHTGWVALAVCAACSDTPAKPDVPDVDPAGPIDTDARPDDGDPIRPGDDDRFNEPPTLGALEPLTIEEDAVDVPVRLVVSDDGLPDGTLTWTFSTANESLIPSSGLTHNGMGVLLITPARDAHGSTEVTATVSDGLATATRSFLVTITPIEDGPEIASTLSLQILEDEALDLELPVVDVDTPLGDLAFTTTSNNEALLPTRKVTTTFRNGAWFLRIAPTPNAFGEARIRISITDGTYTVQSAVEVDVTPVPDAPTIIGPATIVLDEDGQARVAYALDDIDTGTEQLRVELSTVGPGLFGPRSVALQRPANATLELVVVPLPNAYGQGTATISITDPEGASTQLAVALQVLPVLDPPQPVDDDRATVGAHRRLEGSSVLVNDLWVDGTSLAVIPESVSSAAGGDVTFAADGTFTYDAPIGYLGPDSFQYRIDWDGEPVAGTVRLRVVGPLAWFIDHAAAPGGDGRAMSPFDTVAAWLAAPLVGPGDGTFVHNSLGPDHPYEGMVAQAGMQITGTPIDDPPVIRGTGRPAMEVGDGVSLRNLRLHGDDRGVVTMGALRDGLVLEDVDIQTDGVGVAYSGEGTDILFARGLSVDAGAGLAIDSAGTVDARGSLASDGGPTLAVVGAHSVKLDLDEVRGVNAVGGGVQVSADTGTVAIKRIDVRAVHGPAMQITGPRLTISDDHGVMESDGDAVLLLTLPRASIQVGRLAGGPGGRDFAVDLRATEVSDITVGRLTDGGGGGVIEGRVRIASRFFATMRNTTIVASGDQAALDLAGTEGVSLYDVTVHGGEVGIAATGTGATLLEDVEASGSVAGLVVKQSESNSVVINGGWFVAGPSTEATGARAVHNAEQGALLTWVVSEGAVFEARGMNAAAMRFEAHGLGTQSLYFEDTTFIGDGDSTSQGSVDGVQVVGASPGDLELKMRRVVGRDLGGAVVGIDRPLASTGRQVLDVSAFDVLGSPPDVGLHLATSAASITSLTVLGADTSFAGARLADIDLDVGGRGAARVWMRGNRLGSPTVGAQLRLRDRATGCLDLYGNTATAPTALGFHLATVDYGAWSLVGYVDEDVGGSLAKRSNGGSVLDEGNFEVGPASGCPVL